MTDQKTQSDRICDGCQNPDPSDRRRFMGIDGRSLCAACACGDSDRDNDDGSSAVERALSESQADRDRLTRELERARRHIDLLEGWLPIEPQRLHAVVVPGEYDAAPLALFFTREDADAYVATLEALPADDRPHDVHVGTCEIQKIALWDRFGDPPAAASHEDENGQ